MIKSLTERGDREDSWGDVHEPCVYGAYSSAHTTSTTLPLPLPLPLPLSALTPTLSIHPLMLLSEVTVCSALLALFIQALAE